MVKLIKILILFALASLALDSLVAKAEILSTDSINSSIVKRIEEWIDKDTLVFIEIDDTIMMPKSLMFSHKSNPYRQFIENMISMGRDIPTYNTNVAKWYMQRKVKLVEGGWSGFINRLKDKGASVYGLCSMPIELSNIEEWRYNEAKNLNINFTASVNQKNDFILKKGVSRQSRFYKGIVYAGSESKFLTLQDFLRVTNNVPPKMLIIASTGYEVRAIERSLRVFNMEHKTLQYLRAREAGDRPNDEVAQFQQQELIRNGQWFEDEEAARMLISLKKEPN